MHVIISEKPGNYVQAISFVLLLLVAFLTGCEFLEAGELTEQKEYLTSGTFEFSVAPQVCDVAYSDDGTSIAWEDYTHNQVTLVANKQVTKYDTTTSGRLSNALDKRQSRFGSLVFAPLTNRLFFKEKKGSKEHIVCDGKEGPSYDEVYGLIFGPKKDQFAYIAKNNGEEFVVLVDKEQQKYAKILAQSLQFSADGSQIGYIAEKVKQTANISQKQCVVVGEKEKQTYWGIQNLTLSPDGTTASYSVVENADNRFLVCNGKVDRTYDWAGQFAYSPDNKHLAYVTGNPDDECDGLTGSVLRGKYGKQFVVEDNVRKGNDYDEIQSLQYFPSGELAFIAKKNNKIFLVINDKEEPKSDLSGQEKAEFILPANGAQPFHPGPVKITYQDGKEQILYRNMPSPLLDQVNDPVFNEHLAYFGLLRSGNKTDFGLYIDGQKTVNGSGSVLSPDWTSFAGVRQTGGSFGSLTAFRLELYTISGEKKVGPWHDWVSEPRFISDRKLEYFILDGSAFCYVTVSI